MRADLAVILASLALGAASLAACNKDGGGGDFNWFPDGTCGSAAVIGCGTACGDVGCTFLSCSTVNCSVANCANCAKCANCGSSSCGFEQPG